MAYFEGKCTVFVLSLSLLLVATGCTSDQEKTQSFVESYEVGESERESEVVVAADDLEALAERYLLRQVVGSGITSQEWQGPEEIPPDRLVYFYLYCYATDPDREPLYNGIEAEELESFVQQYFDVSVEHIREYEHYDAETGVYLADGIGGAGSIELEDCREVDGQLELTFAIYSPDEGESYVWGGRVTIREEGDGFRYVSNVRWVDPEDYSLTLEGEHFQWQTIVRPESHRSYGDFVESSGYLIGSVKGEDGKWIISELNLEEEDTTRLIHRPDQDGYELLRMGGSIREGYHYTLYQEAYVTLCDVDIYGKMEDIPLPDLVQPVQWDRRYYPCPYDYNGESWIWAGADGLYVLEDGGAERLMADNANISTLLPQVVEHGYTDLAYSSPRFMLENSKIACQIYSSGAEEPVAVAVFDVAGGEMSSALTYILPTLPRYPIADRYIATYNTNDNPQLLEVQTGEIRDLPFVPIFDSWDYKALLVAEYDRESPDSFNNFRLTLRSFDDLDSEREPLLWAEGDQGFEIAGVTEHYVIIKSRNANAFWLEVARYRD